MTGIYANAKQKNLPGQRVNRHGDGDAASADLSRAKEGNGVLTKPIYSGTPIRSAPRVLRVWFAPWEDSDGDLHDQSYVYLPVDSGRWLVEHNRRRIQDTYRPVRAPVFQQGAGQPGAPSAANAPRANAQGAYGIPSASENGMVSNGTMQQRPTPEAAAQFLNGLLKPSDVIPENPETE
jgi:conjugal transfer pilus assembly protein TraV